MTEQNGGFFAAGEKKHRIPAEHKKTAPTIAGAVDLVGVEGFEPSEWWSQSPLPYRLATPQYLLLLPVFLQPTILLYHGTPEKSILYFVKDTGIFYESRNRCCKKTKKQFLFRNCFTGWGGRIWTLGMMESESTALPLGYTPVYFLSSVSADFIIISQFRRDVNQFPKNRKKKRK